MKGKHYLLFVSLLGTMLLLLTACDGSTPGQTSSQQPGGPSIVGTWTGHCSLSGTEFKQAEFDADGTLVLDS